MGRGEGVTPKADAVRKLSVGGCVKMQTRGEGGGAKNPKNLQMSYVHAPLQELVEESEQCSTKAQQ